MGGILYLGWKKTLVLKLLQSCPQAVSQSSKDTRVIFSREPVSMQAFP